MSVIPATLITLTTGAYQVINVTWPAYTRSAVDKIAVDGFTTCDIWCL